MELFMTVRLTFLMSFGLEAAELPNYSCKVDVKGLGYNGSVAKGVSGERCRKWSSPEVQRHMTKSRRISDSYASWGRSIQSSNFCRNPDGEVRGPWCYIEGEDIPSFRFCDIKICEKIKVVPKKPEKDKEVKVEVPPKTEDDGVDPTVIVLSVLPVVIILMIVVAGCVLTRVKKHPENENEAATKQEAQKDPSADSSQLTVADENS